MRTSEQGKTLIKHYESLHDGDLKRIGLQPKLDTVGIVTVGWGHAVADRNGRWLRGQSGIAQLSILYPDLETITVEEADQLLEGDLIGFENNINSLGIEFSQNEFDALVSFSFNCGFAALKGSTLLKRIISNTGDIMGAFLMWNKSNGVVWNGLTARRKTEGTLFLTGKLVF